VASLACATFVNWRTRRGIDTVLEGSPAPGLRLLEPLGYLDFLSLTDTAGVVVTDSGGVQEETTYLGVPCLTVRPNTERPVTIELGTNRLVERSPDALVAAVRERLREPRTTTRALCRTCSATRSRQATWRRCSLARSSAIGTSSSGGSSRPRIVRARVRGATRPARATFLPQSAGPPGSATAGSARS